MNRQLRNITSRHWHCGTQKKKTQPSLVAGPEEASRTRSLNATLKDELELFSRRGEIAGRGSSRAEHPGVKLHNDCGELQALLAAGGKCRKGVARKGQTQLCYGLLFSDTRWDKKHWWGLSRGMISVLWTSRSGVFVEDEDADRRINYFLYASNTYEDRLCGKWYVRS